MYFHTIITATSKLILVCWTLRRLFIRPADADASILPSRMLSLRLARAPYHLFHHQPRHYSLHLRLILCQRYFTRLRAR